MSRKYIAHNSLLPFYLAWQLEPNSPNYHLTFAYELENNQKTPLLIESLHKLIKLKAYLRQTFLLENDKLIAYIHDDLPPEINFSSVLSTELTTHEQALICKPFDINTKSSIRLNIINVENEQQFIVMFNIHHILMDGYTVDQFISELNQLLANQEINIESADTYISKLKNEPPLRTLKDSDDSISNYVNRTNDAIDEMNISRISEQYEVLHFTNILPDKITYNLSTLSKQCNVSIFNLLLLAFGLFTAKLFDQQQILVTYPVDIRQDKTILGCFVNLITLALDYTAEDTYISLLKQLNEKLVLLKKASKINLNKALQTSNIPSFSYSNIVKPPDLIIENKKYDTTSYPQIAHTNLSIKYKLQNNKWYFTCDVLPHLFPDYFNKSLLLRFFNFLSRLLINSEIALISHDLTFIEEKKKILYEFNNTEATYPENKTLVDLFEQQVVKTPNAVAVVYEDLKLTYLELNQKANQFAYYIRKQYQIKTDDLVSLYLDKNEYLLIAILGVLKAGAAYVPIDINYPDSRINYILKDTNSKIILINEKYRDEITQITNKINYNSSFKLNKFSILAMDNDNIKNKIIELPSDNIKPLTDNSSSSLAYVIYTSGTTSEPKGVMIEHKNVVNFIYSLPYSNDLHLNATFTAPHVFDVSIFDIWSNLLNGHTLYIVPLNILRESSLFVDFLIKNNINKLYLPAALLKIHAPFIEKVKTIHQLLTGVEPLEYKYINKLLKSIKEIVNGYGPTETTVCSTFYNIQTEKLSENNIIPLGKPINNTKTYVLDSNLAPLPIGITGELYIAGVGLARGYLHRPELTKEKFILNPFRTEKEILYHNNEHLYKTGDLVRWLPDGNLEYISRNDFQIKICGHRIELGEIEAQLQQLDGVEQSLVVALEGHDKEKWLCAYYTSPEEINIDRLKANLAKNLTSYMIPSFFVWLKKFPINSNGKIDRKALPKPDLNNFVQEYIAPHTFQEKIICHAFANILDINKIGINDDFINLGGDSLKAVRLASNLQSNFSITVPDIFNLRTPKKLAQKIHYNNDYFKQKLNKIKLFYQNKNDHFIDTTSQTKIDKYLSSFSNLEIDLSLKKSINNVLLTGVTGYLGCNLLHQLLLLTNYNIYLPIRAVNQEEAKERLIKKYEFYFDKPLLDIFNKRIFVIKSNIEKDNLELSANDYRSLVEKIDSIIHSAALVKHYGNYNQFYLANVQATINLLEFCKLTRLKDFHYISTCSVFQFETSDKDSRLYTEENSPNNTAIWHNIYNQTKFQGEQQVINYREKGISGNIYRVGNLAFISENYRTQENIEDNAFFNWLKSLFKMQCIVADISKVQISEADLTAKAIVKLFDKKQLDNGIYHVFNPHIFDLGDVFLNNNALSIKSLSMPQFIDNIINYSNNSAFHDDAMLKFLLHQGWLDSEEIINKATIKVLQNKTQHILKKLNFEWLPITHQTFNKYLGSLKLYEVTG